MKRRNINLQKPAGIFVIILMLQIICLTGCGENKSNVQSDADVKAETNSVDEDLNSDSETVSSVGSDGSFSISDTALMDTSGIFTERDMEQVADTSNAEKFVLKSGQDIEITEEGIYVISGEATDSTVKVNASKNSRIQLVLDGVNINNTNAPAIYVTKADKVFITTTDSENNFQVNGTYKPDGETNVDAVIFSRSDIVMNGKGTLNITGSTGNGISSKDDLKVTGGTCNIKVPLDGLEANDSIAVCGGKYSINAGKDALHSENSDDLTLGYIYFSDGEFNIDAGDDGIHGTTAVQIDGGSIDISSSVEGIEATGIMVNDGNINIYASDDGINASQKSTECNLTVIFNGGNVTISVGPGDTDGVDSNGNIKINGGTIDVTAQVSSFDYETTAEFNGGTVIINGEEVTEIPESMMGGGHGGPGGKGRPDRTMNGGPDGKGGPDGTMDGAPDGNRVPGGNGDLKQHPVGTPPANMPNQDNDNKTNI